jgi:hypothetical protein
MTKIRCYLEAEGSRPVTSEVVMNNEFTDQNCGHANGAANTAASPSTIAEAATGSDPASVIVQVRELLFGDHRRATEGSLKGLDEKLAALTATVEARFADLERRLDEARAQTDHARESGVEAIGAAIAELGDKIKGLVAKPMA